MDTYQLNWTNLDHQVFSILCKKSGEKLSQRDIAKLLKSSPTAISDSLKRLGNLAKIEKTKNINFILLNYEDKNTINLKRIENLKQIYLSGLAEYLKEELSGATIILFGSYSFGEDSNNSDIDIAVIERKDKNLNLEKYEKLLNRPININYYKSFKEININLKNNILNGIIINGSIEL